MQTTPAARTGRQIPRGLITLWSGAIATIPAGWVLCDGNNGTPDLRDKFIVAARQDEGGVAKTNVTGALTQSGGNTAHTHGTPLASEMADGSTSNYSETATDSASHLPPYYALAYIMKL